MFPVQERIAILRHNISKFIQNTFALCNGTPWFDHTSHSLLSRCPIISQIKEEKESWVEKFCSNPHWEVIKRPGFQIQNARSPKRDSFSCIEF